MKKIIQFLIFICMSIFCLWACMVSAKSQKIYVENKVEAESFSNSGHAESYSEIETYIKSSGESEVKIESSSEVNGKKIEVKKEINQSESGEKEMKNDDGEANIQWEVNLEGDHEDEIEKYEKKIEEKIEDKLRIRTGEKKWTDKLKGFFQDKFKKIGDKFIGLFKFKR